jgi:Cu-Zn family superoxide dismutase
MTGIVLSTISSGVQAAPPLQTEVDGEEYIVQADDWLSKLADKFYGDISAYPVIVDATNAKAAEDESFAVIDNPDVIEVGQKLWIPAAPGGEMMEGEMAESEMVGEEMDGAADSSLPASYALPGDSVFPEGVAYNPASGKFYVGSTTDGTLYEGDLASGEVSVFSAGGAGGRTTAIGLKVDDSGNLWVSGGGTGQMFAYNTADGSLVASYTTPAVEQTFINDATVTPDGSVYFTDSFRPVLFKVSALAGGEAESWLDFTGTVLEYGEGFNLNGIAVTPDGRYLLVIHSGTGSLYRIDTETREVIQVDTGGADLTAGDGILLVGLTLYVTRNRFGEIVPVAMAEELSTGAAGSPVTDPSLIFPTTIAQTGDSLLVVNSQFNNRGGSPELPFTVSRVPLAN